MRLPPASSSYSSLVRYGRYVARRCRRDRLTALATNVETVNAALLDAGRAWEDANGPVQDALADRDAADDELDATAQEVRLKLASVSVDAIKKEPYTQIFPQGIAYYTAATLDQEVARYNELKARITESLPSKDPMRTSVPRSITESLAAYQTATTALEEARTAESMASTKLGSATEAWVRQMEKTYGALVAEVGRARADGFFPKLSARKVRTPEEPTEPTPTPVNPF